MKHEAGFTLIELLISIAIIGLLVSAVLPALIGAQKRSYDTGAQSCAKSIQTVQAIQQVDTRSYSLIGSSGIDRSTDGIDSSCKQPEMYVKDRSEISTIATDYVIDVWDKRGSKVFTVNPAYLKADVSGATPFSPTGAGGSNLP